MEKKVTNSLSRHLDIFFFYLRVVLSIFILLYVFVFLVAERYTFFLVSILLLFV